jgi:VanZ family protein
VIFYLSSLSGESLPSVRISDKVIHAIEFGGLAVLLCRALRAQAPSCSLRLVALVSILATIGYGLTDEFHQLFVPARTADLADAAADSLGALLAAWSWVTVSTHWQWLQ